jgi:DNA polymerase-3 subunit epsilon
MDLPIHVIDFEGNRQLGIAEWGVVSLIGQKISNVRTQLCPSFFSPEKAPLHCVDFKQNAAYFLQLRRTGIFCSHSWSIEDNLLRHYWASPGYVPSFTSTSRVTTWGPWLDTYAIWTHMTPGLISYNLMELIQRHALRDALQQAASEYCPPDRAHPHAALYDALAAALLLRLLIQSAPHRTLEDWIFYSNPRSEPM